MSDVFNFIGRIEYCITSIEWTSVIFLLVINKWDLGIQIGPDLILSIVLHTKRIEHYFID